MVEIGNANLSATSFIEKVLGIALPPKMKLLDLNHGLGFMLIIVQRMTVVNI